MFDQFVRSTVRPPSMNGAIRLISSADRTSRPGFCATASIRPAERLRRSTRRPRAARAAASAGRSTA